MAMDMCELCRKRSAITMRAGMCLCSGCLNDFENVLMNNTEALRKCANDANFPNASDKAKREIINPAKRKLGLNVATTTSEALEKEIHIKNGEKEQENKKESGIAQMSQSGMERKMYFYRLKYDKVLSTSEKREWIEDYVNIKRFVSGFYTVLGIGIGFILGRLFEYGWDIEMMVLLFIGGAVGGILGKNSVGTAMMQAITAEQNIVNEEVLTEILNKLYEEE